MPDQGTFSQDVSPGITFICFWVEHAEIIPAKEEEKLHYAHGAHTRRVAGGGGVLLFLITGSYMSAKNQMSVKLS